MFPAIATVGGTKNTAFLIRAPDLPLYGNPGNVWIGGMDFYTCNLATIFKADMIPGLASIGGLPHAVTGTRGHAADGCLASTHVQHVVIGLRYCDRTDRTDFEKLIRDILPGRPRVFSFPHATAGGPHVVQHRLVRHTRHRGHTTTPVWADHPPFKTFNSGVIRAGIIFSKYRPGRQK